jgi:putative transposase
MGTSPLEGRFQMGVGSVLSDGVREWTIQAFEKLGGVLYAVVDVDGQQLTMPIHEVFQMLMMVSTLPADADLPQEALVQPGLERLPAAVRAMLYDRAAHMSQVETGSRAGDPELDRARGKLNPDYDPDLSTHRQRAKRKARELGVNEKTIYKWAKNYETAGVMGLVDRRWLRYKRSVLDQMDASAAKIIRDVVTEQQGQTKLPTRRLAIKARARLDADLPDVEVDARTLENAVAEASRGKALHLSSKSQREHMNRHEGPPGLPVATRPGEVFQVDTTPANMKLTESQGWISAVILTAICAYTGIIAALRVVPGAASAQDAMLLIWDALQFDTERLTAGAHQGRRWLGIPKFIVVNPDETMLTDVEARRGQHVNKTGAQPSKRNRRTSMAVSVVIIDHGSEYDATMFVAACAANGIEVMFARPGNPADKGHVEGWHRQLAQLQAILPGATGANVQDRGRNVEKHVALTCLELQEALQAWVNEVYHHTPQRNLRSPDSTARRESPAMVFDRYLRSGGSIEVPYRPDQFLYFLESDLRVIGNTGIQLNNKHYWHPRFKKIREHTQQGLGLNTSKVSIRYHRDDSDYILVQDPLTQQWLRADRTDRWGGAVAPFFEGGQSIARQDALSGEQRALTPDEGFAWEVAWTQKYAGGAKGRTRRKQAQKHERQVMHQAEQEAWPDLPASADATTATSESDTERYVYDDYDHDEEGFML